MTISSLRSITGTSPATVQLGSSKTCSSKVKERILLLQTMASPLRHTPLYAGDSAVYKQAWSLLFSFFSTPPWPQSLKVTRISQLVLSKMTSLLPYLGTKYFPLLLLLQPSSDFPHHRQRHTFISTFPESWAGGRKALSSPSSLIEIKVWPLIPTVLV